MLSTILPVSVDVPGSAAAEPHQAAGENVADLAKVRWEVRIALGADHGSISIMLL